MTDNSKLDIIIQKVIKKPIKTAFNITIEELTNVLRYFSAKYYNEIPLISDDTFDTLKVVLEERDPNNPYLKEIGAPVVKDYVVLPYPMGSMNKIKLGGTELDAWIAKYKGPYVISDKLDGASAGIVRDKSGKIKMYSRGNEKEGQDITHLLPYVLDYKSLQKAMPNDCAIRGELIISKTNFEKINNLMKKKYKNARNTVAGLVNSKDFSVQIASHTEFIGYSIIHPKSLQLTQLKTLENMKVKTVPYAAFDNISYDILKDYYTVRREKSEYDIDGIIVCDDSKVYDHVSGNPDYAFAFKMNIESQMAITEVISVTWEPSMYKYMKPTVQMKPVELSGVTVSNANAHNARYVMDKKLGSGAIIKIIRSGDVIPYILQVIKPADKPAMPDMDYIWNKTNIDIIVTGVIESQNIVITTKQIAHFFKSIGVKNISEGIIKKLVQQGYNTIHKILVADKMKLAKIEGLGIKSISKIFANIEESFQNTKLENIMAGSLIYGRGMGQKKLNKIVAKFPNIVSFTPTHDQVIDIQGFDDISATQFVNNHKQFLDFFKELETVDYLDVKQFKQIKEKQKTSDKLVGLKIVFTGFRNEELTEKITDAGGTISTKVSKNTNILLYKNTDKAKNSTNYKTAIDLGIIVMTEEEFIDKYKL